MTRVILADNQSIFRAGAARVLALEDDLRIVAQCEDAARLLAAVAAHRGAVVLYASSLGTDQAALVRQILDAGSRAIVIAENGESLDAILTPLLHGAVFRNIGGSELVDAVRRVSRGQRCMQNANVTVFEPQDSVGSRVRDRLTPKEMQIVALIVQGCKNKDIATQLGTKEQVIKNYLRGIYDKTGVSDRLELALFVIHHKVLAEAAARAANLIEFRTA